MHQPTNVCREDNESDESHKQLEDLDQVVIKEERGNFVQVREHDDLRSSNEDAKQRRFTGSIRPSPLESGMGRLVI